MPPRGRRDRRPESILPQRSGDLKFDEKTHRLPGPVIGQQQPFERVERAGDGLTGGRQGIFHDLPDDTSAQAGERIGGK
jgi:hypothetical protein